jgi:hypothetical protein
MLALGQSLLDRFGHLQLSRTVFIGSDPASDPASGAQD